jgi:hypothetical protein
VALLLAGPVLGVRVQVVDLVFAAAVLWLLWRFQIDARLRWLVALPFISIAWVNLHAGWLLLFLFGGATLVGEAGDRLLRRRLTPEPISWPRIGQLTAAIAVSAVALAANPNGTAIYGYPGYTAGIGALADFVGEWQHATLSNLFGWLLLGFVALGVVPTFLLGWRSMRSSDALILLGVTGMSLIAVRFLLITGPIGAAIVAVNLGPALSRSAIGLRWSPTLNRLARPMRGRITQLNLFLAAALLVSGGVVAFVRAAPGSQDAEIAREFPVSAVAWLRGHAETSRIFNKYEWGGYIGLNLPGSKIFIDGRADVYGDALIREYVSVIGLEANPGTILDKYAVNQVLYPPDTALAGWLDVQKDWHRDYADSVAVIWSRR